MLSCTTRILKQRLVVYTFGAVTSAVRVVEFDFASMLKRPFIFSMFVKPHWFCTRTSSFLFYRFIVPVYGTLAGWRESAMRGASCRKYLTLNVSLFSFAVLLLTLANMGFIPVEEEGEGSLSLSNNDGKINSDLSYKGRKYFRSSFKKLIKIHLSAWWIAPVWGLIN